jgi:flagellar hook-associated protein 2
MATITSTGIGSGLDVNSIVTQLMALESRPLTLLQRAESSLNTRMSAIGTLQSRMAGLRDASNALTSVSLWNQTIATSSNAAAVRVSTTTGAAAGSYAVQVQALASAQTLASQSFASSTAEVGAGTLSIELGSWTGEPTPTGFVPKSGAAPVTVTIGAGETSLAAIRDKINGANAGVTATIINDASGARLSLRSKETGAENAFRVTATESVDDGNAATGLSTLGYTALGAGSPMARSQSAANAAATINGIAVTSASNTLNGVADGLTLTLQQVTTSAAEVKVAADTEAVKTSINSFVTAFNEVANYIRDQTKYNPDTKVGGTLQGDRLVGSLQAQLRGIVNAGSSASGVFQRLSDVGISFTTTGTLQADAAKINNALGNLPELRKVLAADGADNASSGFVDRFKDFASSVLGGDGAFENRNASLKGQLSLNAKSQESMERRLTQTEERLRRQYQALDAAMSQLNGTSTYLTQQLDLLAKNSSSR